MAEIRVTVWNEYRHEKKNPEVAAIYPEGMHGTIAKFLAATADEGAARLVVRTATLDEPEHGLTDEVLHNTEVLIWWGHVAHGEVKPEIVGKVKKRVLEGMGLIVLHSAHVAQIFQALMGTTCQLKWREAEDREILWFTAPGHPIVAGLADHIVVPREEMYGEYFDIPEPDEVVMISSFTGGEVCRSCCTFKRGAGRIVYFRPGHETHPTYHQPEIQRVIINAVRYVAPGAGLAKPAFGHRQPL